jgi:hypothetical protein
MLRYSPSPRVNVLLMYASSLILGLLQILILEIMFM